MAGPRAFGWLGTVEAVVQRITHPLGECLEHGNVDVLAFTSLLAVQERRQDVGVGVHAGGDIGNRWTRLGWGVFGACHRHKTRLALNQQVIRFFVAVGAVVTIARDVADDDVGLDGL